MIKRVSKLYSKAVLEQIARYGVFDPLSHAMSYVEKLERAVFGSDQGGGGEYFAFIGGENPYYETVKRLSRECKRVTVDYTFENPEMGRVLRVDVVWYKSGGKNIREQRPGCLTFRFIKGGVTQYSWSFGRGYEIEE